MDWINVIFTNAANVTISTNNLIKSSGGSYWNGGASSTQFFGGDGGVRCTAITGDTFIGLSYRDVDQNYTSINYGLYMDVRNDIYIYENGSQINGIFTTYIDGDICSIERVSNVVKYYKNGSLLYTSSINSYAPLKIDTSIYGGGEKLYNVQIAGISDSSIIENDDYTKLLVHCDGSVEDDTGKHITNNNVSFIPSIKKVGNASIKFDGTNDYLTFDDDIDFTLGSDDFTIDLWFRPLTINRVHWLTGQGNSSGSSSSASFGISVRANNTIVVGVFQGSSDYEVTSSTTVVANTWYHIALIRYGTSIKLYVNGVSEGTPQTVTGALNDSSNDLSVGRLGEYPSFYTSGWIDEYRLSVGIARWTTTFVPSTSPYASDSYTKLLLHGEDFIDSSSSAHTVTIVGSPIIAARLGTHSLSFNGIDSYLTTNDSNNIEFGSGDFTLDCWVKFTNLPSSGNYVVLVIHTNNVDKSWTLQFKNDSGTYKWEWYVYSGGYVIDFLRDGISITTNTWYHVAITRYGNDWRLFQDGTQLGTTVNNSGTIPDIDGLLYIGQQGNNAKYLEGYLDEINISKGTARWISNFTPSSSPYIKDQYTSFLYHCDASTNFIDYSPSAHVITTNGEIHIDTTQSKFGGSAALTDGSGDYLSIDDNTDFTFGSNDFTIDFWVRFTTLTPSVQNLFGQCDGAGTGTSISVYGATTEYNKFYFAVFQGGTGISITSTSMISINTWYHYAVVRSGTTLNLFINGTSVGSNSVTGSLNNSVNKFSIGQLGEYTSGNFLYGWIEEFRVSNGIARWVSNFTPPSSPYGYTKLLMHCDLENEINEFFDYSVSNHLITTQGDTQVDTINSKFGNGSILFDGEGDDYLSIADTEDFDMTTNKFTIDFWVRFNNLPATTDSQMILSQRFDNNNYIRVYLYNNAGEYQWAIDAKSGGTVRITVSAGSPGLSTDMWYHVALVREENYVHFFQDGQLCYHIPTDIITFIPNIGASIEIGRLNTSQYYLDGNLDELRVSNEIARWTANFQPPIAPYSLDGYDSTLLHFEGADASTVFTDESGKTWSVVGDTQIDTAQYKFGSASGYFDGSSDYLTVPNNSDFNFGSGDFTIDFWFRAARVNSDDGIFTISSGSTALSCAIYNNRLYYVVGNTGGDSWGDEIITNIWYHIAFVRRGNSVFLFQNGKLKNIIYVAGISLGGDDFRIGQYATPGTHNFFGWLDEFRVSKGIARFINSFIPPTIPYGAVAGELEYDLVDSIVLNDTWEFLTNPEQIELLDTVYLSDSWLIQTDPETKEIPDTLSLSDLWIIQTNPDQIDIANNIFLLDEWTLHDFGTVIKKFATKLYTTLPVLTTYGTRLYTIFNSIKKFNTKLYTQYLTSTTYATDLRVRVEPIDAITIGTLDDFLVKLDGVTLVDVDYNSLNITLSLNNTPSNARFTLSRRHDNLDKTLSNVTSQITNENKVEIFDGTRKLFTGYISIIDADSTTDTIHITAEDVRYKMNKISMELKYGGAFNADSNHNGIIDEEDETGEPAFNTPDYIKFEKNIGTAFLEIMTAVGSLVSGYDSLPFPASFVPEYVTTENTYCNLIDELLRQTANVNWYIDENERLRFNRIGAGVIKTLPLSSLAEKRHPYDLIVHDVQLNKQNPAYAKSLLVKRGKGLNQHWNQRGFGAFNLVDFDEFYNKNLVAYEDKEYFVFHSRDEFMGMTKALNWYTGHNSGYAAEYMTYINGITWLSDPYIIVQWLDKDENLNLPDITVGSGQPVKTIHLTSYGKRYASSKWEDVAREELSPPERYLAWVKNETYDYTNFLIDIANFELSQNNKLQTSANLSMLLDAYKYYNLSFQNLVNLTNTIQSGIYSNNNGFPLNIDSIQINCATRTVTLNTTNYGKTWAYKSLSYNASYVPSKIDYRYPLHRWFYLKFIQWNEHHDPVFQITEVT